LSSREKSSDFKGKGRQGFREKPEIFREWLYALAAKKYALGFAGKVAKKNPRYRVK
jgi:hypothetical protein